MTYKIKPKKRSYGFLTSKSNLVEVKAYNSKQAYKLAKKEHEKFRPKYKEMNIELGDVTPNYVTYGKSGFAEVGKYKQVKMYK